MPAPPYAVPSRRDRVVAAASGALGGPAGRYAVIGGRGLAGVAAAVVALGAVAVALGVFQKGHCLAKGWVNPDQFWRTCYSDLPVLHVTTGLAGRQFPLSDPPLDQPLGSALVMWLISLVTPQAGTGVGAQQWVLAIWAVLAVLLLAAGALAVVALRPRRPWQAAHLTASPVLVVLALVSVDLAGVALVLVALWCWKRRAPGWAGVLFALALLVRPYAVVFLVAVLLVGWREDRRHDATRLLVGAVLTVLGLLLALCVLFGDAVLLPIRSWWQSAPGYGALSLIPQLHNHPLIPGVSTAIAVVGFLLAPLLGAHLARHRRRPGIAQLAAPMLLVLFLTAKAVPVQAGVWVLPLLALSTVRWRDHLVWAGAEILHFVTVWLHIGFGSDPGKGLPGTTYSLFILLRMAALAWVCYRVWEARPPRIAQRAPAVSPTNALVRPD